MPAPARHRVVVVGSGFGGLFATKVLRHVPCDVTVIDRTTHHLFQPLLYQVATGILSEGEIAPPIRDILRHQHNVSVVLGDVTDIDIDARAVTSRIMESETVTPYDSLIVAAGARTSYFGNDHYARYAPGMKSIDDALELRGRIFGAFELAELEEDPAVRAAWMTFVVIGGGPTGVEMAGQIAELAHRTLTKNFRRINPRHARIVLVDGAPTILGGFGERLAGKARRELERLGVEVHNNAMVAGVDERGLDLDTDTPAIRRIESFTKVWAAGVSGSPLGAMLCEKAGVQTGRGGRVPVEPDCTLPGHPEIFVVGDLMQHPDNFPGVAEVAMQSGMHSAMQIDHRLKGDATPRRFRYRSLGDLASISRYFAIGKWGRIEVTGFLGWVIWLVVHLTFLTGFKNRITALFHWVISFLGRSRSERTITMQQIFARRALEELAEAERAMSADPVGAK
jgi:NADH dehydrogenase